MTFPITTADINAYRRGHNKIDLSHDGVVELNNKVSDCNSAVTPFRMLNDCVTDV